MTLLGAGRVFLEIFDPDTGVWEEGERMVEAKSGMATVVVDRGMLSEEVQEAVYNRNLNWDIDGAELGMWP